MTRLAPKPPYCASCFQQKSVRHVDFEAAYDGPVIPGSPHVAIDDLILCEDCLAEAFAILDPENLKATIRELETVVKDLIDDNEAKDRMIQGFHSTTRELVDHPIKKFPGKPKLEGVTPEVREAITRARFERRGTTSDPTQKKKKVAA